MKNIPVFTTEYGIASLVLQQIPYRQEAYIRIHETRQPEKLLAECMAFCRACGAERIYADAGEGIYPQYSTVYEMRGTVRALPELTEHLFPVTPETVKKWRAVCNERMRAVDNASYLAAEDDKRILSSNGAYFIHRDGVLLGIGWLEEDCLVAVASAVPGAGLRVAHTLLSLREGRSVSLEVVSTNHKALRLYEQLGFIKTRELIRWYKIL